MYRWTAKTGVEIESELPLDIPPQDRYPIIQLIWSYQYTFKKVVKDWWLTREKS